jgi:hypothetical protein
MTTKKPGLSPDYRDLLKGRITPEEYVRKMKQDVNRRLNEDTPARRKAAAAG